MDYNISDLKVDIRKALDENHVSTQLITDEDIDTLTVEEIIESRIPIAARIIIQLAPMRMLGSGKAFFTPPSPPDTAGDTITWYGTGTCVGGSVRLPNDFLRFMSYKMSDWDHAAYTHITEIDPQYQVQFSPFAGLRGNQHQPVVAITGDDEGLRLEFFSSRHTTTTNDQQQVVDDSATVDMARYMPLPVIRTEVTGTAPNTTTEYVIDIPQLLHDPVVYYAAYLTALTLAQSEAASHLLATAQQMLET